VVVAVPELLEGSGSEELDVAVAVLVIVVPGVVSLFTETVRVRVALSKARIVPKLAVTVLVILSNMNVPWLTEALTKVVRRYRIRERHIIGVIVTAIRNDHAVGDLTTGNSHFIPRLQNDEIRGSGRGSAC
jgi:hypothetical protein